MIRIAGVSVDGKKHARFSLSLIKGVGKSNVKKILTALDMPYTTRLDDLEEQKIVEIRNYIETNYIVEADLRRQQQANIKRLIDINSYRGLRHKANLPSRGQRTKTNSRTRRGNKRNTGSSGRAKSAAKT